MSNTQFEEYIIDLINLFKKHVAEAEEHIISEQGMVNMMKENFPNFLKTHEEKGTDFWANDSEIKDTNKKLDFAQSLSLLGKMAIDNHRQSQGATPGSGGSQ
ncbi:protein S100-A7-like [Perognathus longimembris pacificus]|uniref:protein S100-A7-like n=1 Tax=Perognathus longimembris pacificus TaxID=214514 RepID=UPI002019D5D1|nr:protein S100-A7-like [Perognathus longimembris pacificus]